SILFVGDGFPVPLHSGLFTASPNPFGRFSRLLREAKRLPYAPTNSNLSLPRDGITPGSRERAAASRDSSIIEKNGKEIKSKIGGKAFPVTFSLNPGRFNNFCLVFLYTLHG
ncbi:MAG: hypothetical protein SPG79_05540, partial [Candidatus Faecousia sp.]|nr:hypothetical protein [Candidatus Faecousia sp.]